MRVRRGWVFLDVLVAMMIVAVLGTMIGAGRRCAPARSETFRRRTRGNPSGRIRPAVDAKRAKASRGKRVGRP